MERIEIDERQERGVAATYILPQPLTAESIINKALWTVFAVLLIAVISTFFVEDIPDAIIDARAFAIDGLWLALCGFAIGELLKQIFRNKGRSTEEYRKVKKDADDELTGLTTDELSVRQDYCKHYEDEEYSRCFERLLVIAGITKDEYKQYAHLSDAELKKKFPKLPKAQRAAIVKLNRLKPLFYDPSFFLSAEQGYRRAAPSQLYNADTENKRNTLTSIFLTAISSLCALSFVGTIVFSFSLATLVAAVVKVATILFLGSFKAVFGWNLAMRTEINRYSVIIKECKNLKAFAKNKEV
jgi:hypothetical protein